MASRRIEVEIIGDPRSVEAAFGRALTASQKFQKGLAPVARGAKYALGGVVALGIGTTKLANDFNRTSSQMVGLAGVGSKQVDEWKESILDLAPIVGKTPKELAEGLYFIASSGVPAAKALDALTVSAKGSTAGLGETEVVADAITSAMNAYADANLSAAQAGDVLAATVREGKGEASQIAPVLGNILPIASQLGVGFEEVGAAMASMTRLGFDAATAATNLSGVLNGILKPSQQAEDALHKIGTSSSELQSMLAEDGLLKTLQFLRDRFEGNNAVMARVFPNVRALRGVLALVGKAGADTAKVFDRMTDNTGALNHAFEAVDDDSLALDQAWASLQASGIRLGNTVAPAVASLASAFADAATFAGDHATETKAAALATAGLATAVIAANTALKIYNSELVKILGLQGGLRTALAVAPWLALAGAIAYATDYGLDRLHDALNDTEEQTDAATTAARQYKAALDALSQSTDDLQDAKSRESHAELNEIATRRQARDAIKEYGRSSLEARQAILNHKDALRELRRAEQGVADATQEHVNAGVRVFAMTKRQRETLEKLTKTYQDQQGEIDQVSDSTGHLHDQLQTGAVEGYTKKLRDFAREAGGADTKAGRTAITVANLTEKLGRIPTQTEIRLVTNADHTRDQIEDVRAAVQSVPRTNIIDFFIRTHGSPPGTTPTGIARQHGGDVLPGRAYIVGERRAEVFIPNRAGRIAPRVAAGGGPTIIMNFPRYIGDRRELEREMRGSLERIMRKGASLGARRLG